jgi:hypothetical protein
MYWKGGGSKSDLLDSSKSDVLLLSEYSQHLLTIRLIGTENGLGRYRLGRRALYIKILRRQANGYLKSFATQMGRTDAISLLLSHMHGKIYAAFRPSSNLEL